MTNEQLLTATKYIPKDIIVDKAYGTIPVWADDDNIYEVQYDTRTIDHGIENGIRESAYKITIENVRMFDKCGKIIGLSPYQKEMITTIFSIALYKETDCVFV